MSDTDWVFLETLGLLALACLVLVPIADWARDKWDDWRCP